MIERKGEVTVKGNPLTLLGKKPAVGDAAPDFKELTSHPDYEAALFALKEAIKV